LPHDDENALRSFNLPLTSLCKIRKTYFLFETCK
jgi:hypothetical protein